MSRPSPALAVSIVAVVIAAAGSGYAAVVLPRNSVASQQVRNHSLRAVDFKRGVLKAGRAGAAGTAGATGATGATGPQGAKGDAGPAGAQGAKGDTGPKGDTGAAGVTTGASALGTEGGQQTVLLTSCTTTLATATIAVPASGIVEALAVADLKGSSSVANVCIVEPSIGTVQVLSTNSMTFETRYSVPGSTTGTTVSSSAGWLVFDVSPGSHTFSLMAGHTTGSNATFDNAKLLLRAYK